MANCNKNNSICIGFAISNFQNNYDGSSYHAILIHSIVIQLQIDRNDPNSWDDELWAITGPRRVGFLGIYVGKYGWMNRQETQVYNVFKNLLQREDIWTSVDRQVYQYPSSILFYSIYILI